MSFIRSLALAGLCLASVVCGAARAASAPTLGHSGRWITDATGRVVIVHGINMVYKLPPYYPAAVGFGDDDAAFLSRNGLDAVRVGVIWKALEPSPGSYDDAYLSQIASTVDTLARHGVLALLDFHQDLFNERFQGEGAPDWAVQDSILPNPSLGFPGNYLANPALQHALDAFWNNSPGPGGVGLQNRFAAAWAHVAARLRGSASILGYELFNEPWPGTVWQPCALPPGCPGFDALLTAFNRRIDAGIRSADRRGLVWYEPNVLFNSGSTSHLGPIGDRAAGFAFHDYCLTVPSSGTSAVCDQADDRVFTNAVAHATSTRDALLETEFGATDNTAYLDDMVSRADRFMVPWLEWAYCGCGDPTTTGPGTKQAIVVDPRQPPTGSNLVQGTLRALVEPYPRVVAGTPRGWSFDRSSRTFRLSFTTARASGRGRFRAGAISEIVTPALVYGRSYAARVRGGRIVSRPGASLLQVASCRGATSVSVAVAPSGHGIGSCTARRRRP
jgi:endoglycosylceramidase